MAEPRKKQASPASKPLKSKVARLWSEALFNRPINWPSLLLQASIKLVVRLPVPHTLITVSAQDSSFLYTDSEGILRSRGGESARISREFLESCGTNRRKEKNLNPSGLRFPKFIRRNEGLVIAKKHDLGDLTTPAVIQKFIIPSNFKPHRRIISWRRTKPTKVYTLTIRPEHLNPAISRGDLDSCDVRLEVRMSEVEESILQTLRQIVEAEIGGEERLEGLVVEVMQDLQGLCHFLAASRARTSPFQKMSIAQIRRSSVPTIAELSTRLQATESFSPLPPLAAPLSAFSLSVPQASGRRRHSEIAEHIDLVAAKFDKIAEEAKERRTAFEVYRALTSSEYEQGFFDSAMKAISVAICRNQVLGPFFGGKESRVEEIVRKIFVSGVDIGRTQAVHAVLSIRKTEFDVFVGVVEDSLRRQGAQEQDLQKAGAYLRGFEGIIVSNGKDLVSSP